MLQGKALGLILQKVQQVMQRATEAVREDLAQSLPAGTGPGPAAGGYKGASFSNLLRSGSFAGALPAGRSLDCTEPCGLYFRSCL